MSKLFLFMSVQVLRGRLTYLGTEILNMIMGSRSAKKHKKKTCLEDTRKKIPSLNATSFGSSLHNENQVC